MSDYEVDYTKFVAEHTGFRAWVNQMWFEHKDEVLQMSRTAVNYDFAEYFQRNRWWLKRTYKEKQHGNVD